MGPLSNMALECGIEYFSTPCRFAMTIALLEAILNPTAKIRESWLF